MGGVGEGRWEGRFRWVRNKGREWMGGEDRIW